jgi:hypothetical protein
MNLNENINRIKQVMGLLNEQTEKVIEVVKGTYTAKGCDELHAFESTCPSKQFDKNGKCIGDTKLVGEMHTKMLEKLNALYENGHNPKVSNVGVTVNGNTVSWECTIVESADGKAWVGFTSRGAGCNNDIVARATSSTVGNDLNSLRGRINAKYGESNIEIEEAKDYTYDGGGNSFRQIFYRYTKPKNFPSHKNKQSVVPPVKPDSNRQITPIVPSADTAKTNNTLPVFNQTTTTVPTTQPTYNYPDINKNPFNPRNGDPWRYAYDGTNLIIKKKGSNKTYNLMDPNYFKTYSDSKIKTTEKLNKAKAAIKHYYGNQLGMP